MLKFKTKPIIVEATQWFKNGDHPLDYSKTATRTVNGETVTYSPEERKQGQWEGDIVRYFRHPTLEDYTVCCVCNKSAYDHGWIDDSNGGKTVCPGDWIVTKGDGEYYPCKPHVLEFALGYDDEIEVK